MLLPMRKAYSWSLPGLLAVAQLILWSIDIRALSRPPGVIAWTAAFAATALTVLALGRRRRAPLAALGGALTASVLAQLLVPPDTLGLVVGVAVLIALYSVAALSDAAVGLGATAAAILVQLLPGAVRHGFGGDLLSAWLITAGSYLLAAALGAGRRQWVKDRRVTKQRLSRAEDEREQAAGTERERLARELHDISAHHLTSVVVSVDAARRLGAARPELTAEALEFATRTARETQSALQRLVAVMQKEEAPVLQPMTGQIEALVASFGRLGRPIPVSLPDDLAGPAAEAAHGIVRESLTNVLRYAPGAAVDVRAERIQGALRLTIDNGGPPGGIAPHEPNLGSGRGVAGMRERAAAVGGELSAGPRPEGGWRVRALLPEPAASRRSAAGRRRDFTREQRMADGAVFGSVVVASLSLALSMVGDAGLGIREYLLLALLLTVHALPLLWRRRAPWLVLASIAATALPWPVLFLGDVLPPSTAIALAVGVLAESTAVYSVAAYGRVLRNRAPPALPGPPAPHLAYRHGFRLSPLSVPAMALSFSVAITAAFAVDGTLLGEPTELFSVLFVFGEALVFLTLGFTASWLAGWSMHRRRRRVLSREDAALTVLLSGTRTMVDGERRRIAHGLRETVLRQTAQVIASAEAGSLDDVAAATREALASMRRLLQSLSAGEAAPPAQGGFGTV